MAPSAIYEPVVPTQVNKGDLLKVCNAPLAYQNKTWKKPVADDYMYAFKYNFPLPTHNSDTDALDFTQDDETHSHDLAHRFLGELEQVIQSRDAEAFANLFLDCGTYIPGKFGQFKD